MSIAVDKINDIFTVFVEIVEKNQSEKAKKTGLCNLGKT